MKNLTKNIVALRNNMFVSESTVTKANLNLAMSLQSEMMQFGYIFSKEAFDVLSMSSDAVIINYYNEVLPYLKDITGAKRSYKAFWPGFPTQVMEKSECELWFHQSIHYLSNGCYIPNDFTKARSAAFEHVKYTVIKSGSELDFDAIFTDLVSVNSSLTPTDLEIVDWFVKSGRDLKFPEVVPFKENLCTVIGSLVTSNALISLPKLTTTDVLRIITYMSGGDISLPKVPHKMVRLSAWSSSKVANPERAKFMFKKFSRPERKFILNLLENTNCDVREMKLKRERWIRIGEILHPSEYAKAFPKAYNAFNLLRNTKVMSWNGEVNKAFKISFVEGLSKLSERPGEFLRKLDFLIRTSKPENVKVVYAALKGILPKVSNKVLFEVYTHFEKRNTPKTNRTIMVKGARKPTTLPDLPAISEKNIMHIKNLIMDTLLDKFETLDDLGLTYIDEELKKIPVPTNMRSMNDSLRPVIRGQRVPLDNPDAKVIRAFVHWYDERGRLDIDLTGTFIGPGVPPKRIGWNGDHNCNLGCYSGDIRHRQGACAEYIDINLTSAKNAGYKYCILDVRNYNGGSLSDIPECVTGTMAREFAKANEIFKPDTIQNCFKLTSASENTIISAIDLETKEIIILDIDQAGIPVASVNFEETLQAITPYLELPKFSVYDLCNMHVIARNGSLVNDKSKAETLFESDNFMNSYVETLKLMGV